MAYLPASDDKDDVNNCGALLQWWLTSEDSWEDMPSATLSTADSTWTTLRLMWTSTVRSYWLPSFCTVQLIKELTNWLPNPILQRLPWMFNIYLAGQRSFPYGTHKFIILFTKALPSTVFSPWRWGGSSTQVWQLTLAYLLRIPQMIWVWRAMVEWYIDRGKLKNSEKNLSQCHFVHQ
jgi:hypothetical protein